MSATVVRKCSVSEVDDTRTEAIKMDSCNVTKSIEGKNEVQYKTCGCDGAAGSCNCTLHGLVVQQQQLEQPATSTFSVGTVDTRHRPRSEQDFQNLLPTYQTQQHHIANHCSSYVHHHESLKSHIRLM